ncbi:MAG TPA: type III pantothenate kinase [Mycobacteriales bacterium]
MLLAIDVGNTNTTIGCFEGEKLVDSYRVRTNAHATGDELALQIRGLLTDMTVTGMAISSTVPAVLHELRRMVERYFPDVPVIVVEPGTRTGVPLLYDNPREVGPDRIANTLAAFHLYGGPAVVVDFGTSTNFDVVSARGEFLGGVLAIGIEVGIDALAARGARLFKVEMSRPRAVIGKSTAEALQSGLLYGTVGQIDGIVRRIVGELGEETHVIATGGLAPLVLAESETVQHHEPDLTLIGLRLVFERNHAG